VELALLKGTKDYLPREQILRDQTVTTIKEIFQLYGYQPAQTPILEMWEILASKYAGGEEILKETYKLQDQGQRDLGLRYDLSVPLSRLVGMNPNLGRPFKRYEIGPCFRDGPVKKGRYREFVQCDVDVIGVSSMLADAECLAVAHKIFTTLGLEVYLEVNNRKLLSGILIEAGVPDSLLKTTILSIDKLKKIGFDGVEAELDEKGIDPQLTKQIFSYFRFSGDYLQTLDHLEPKITNKIGQEGISELRDLYHYLQLFQIQSDIKLLYSLARGLEIYTGTVFEAFLKKPGILDSSLCGGGRYDDIIGSFLGGKQEFPAVGISFGLDTIYDALTSVRTPPKSLTQVFIIPIQTLDHCISLATSLRDDGIRTEVDLLDRRISRNLEYADQYEIPYVVIVGKRDLEESVVTLRSMTDGQEKKIMSDKLSSELKHVLG
jgi:histidyl-tRNA synthetase